MNYGIVGLLAIFLSTPVAGQSPSATAGEISGRIVSDSGDVSDIAVVLVAATVGAEARSRLSRQRTFTDQDGSFRFTGLAPPRMYYVSADPSAGLVVQNQSPAGDRGGYRVGESIVITLGRGGVITGRVRTAAGEPVIGVRVVATRVRDDEGKKIHTGGMGRSRPTDDRGVYRIYGLPQGSYLVSTDSSGNHYGPIAPNLGDIPTYYPSATRDSAQEVNVSLGSEQRGVDIVYRNETGHTVRGTLSAGPSQSFSSASVLLINAMTGETAASSAVSKMIENSGAFAMDGVPDGPYEVIVRANPSPTEPFLLAARRRVTIAGGDVGGVDLRLLPMAAISGNVTLKSSATACAGASDRKLVFGEVFLGLRGPALASSPAQTSAGSSFSPNESGAFNVRGLLDGRYTIEKRSLPDEWYLESVSIKATPARARAPRNGGGASDPARDGIRLNLGEQVTGLSLQLARSAARLDGKIAAAIEGGSLPSRMRVHLLPAEIGAADQLLRYAETTVRADHSFSFQNISPGRYFLIARPVSDREPDDPPPAPVALDPNQRGGLRREAEAKKIEIEFAACQRVDGYLLRW